MDLSAKKHKPVIYDPLIIPRVKKYLEENVHQTYVDVAVMSRQLQERYREYSRRKSGPFRVLVEQAYRTVLRSYGIDSNPSSECEDADADGNSDLEVVDDNSNSNNLNAMLTNLYAKNKITNVIAPKTAANNDAIDISSDESGDADSKKSDPKKKAEEPIKGQAIPVIGQRQQSTLDKNSVIVSQVPKEDTNSVSHAEKKRKLDNHNVETTIVQGTGGQIQQLRQKPQGLLSSLPEIQVSHLPQKSVKKYKRDFDVKKSHFTFRDLGGLDRILTELCDLLIPFKHPAYYHAIGVTPPRGFLLHGPPGSGKTLLANAIAGQLNIGIIEVQATELIGGISGQSEEHIRELFDQAAAVAPCVLFIDEIDAISSNRMNAQRDMERRVVSQLIASMDGLSKHEDGDQVLVIGATNRPEALDPALRRGGRFDHELTLGIPDRDEREEILIVITSNLALQNPFDFRKIAELTPGYVAADLVALTTRAASLAVKRWFGRNYRLQQAKLAQNVPVVDLIDEAAGENENSSTVKEKETVDAVAVTKDADDKTKVTQDNVSGQQTNLEQPNGETNHETVIDNDEEMDVDNTPASKENVAETIVTSTNVVTETTSPCKLPADVTVAPETMEIETTQESIDSKQKTVEPEVQNVEKAIVAGTTVDRDAPIDVDELPEQPAHIRRIQELSLYDLINFLSADISPIDDSQVDELCISLHDFIAAVKLVKPSAKREGFITVPDVTWDDVGSLKDIREELQLAVLAPVKYPSKLQVLGLTTPSGVLLCGPPGCGKTLLAKAIANEAGINFISVKGPELMNMYVGESERAVRQCFQRARNSTPCVIFFDEFDSLCPKRSESGDSGSGTRVVNQLLTEMDGIEDRKGVFLMAATNRPDIIDPAVLRPGRLDKVLYVGLPELCDRVEILEALTKKGKKPPLAEDVDLNEVASLTDGYTGADLAGLIRQAAFLALKDSIRDPLVKNSDLKLHKNHVLNALRKTKPSVNDEDKKIYEKLKIKFSTEQSQ